MIHIACLCFVSAVACDMWHDVVDGMLLSSHDRISFAGLDMPRCKARCVSEDTFTCRSIDLYHPENYCFLSEESVETQPNSVWYDSDFSYVERNLDCIGVYKSTLCIFISYQCPMLLYINSYNIQSIE